MIGIRATLDVIFDSFESPHSITFMNHSNEVDEILIKISTKIGEQIIEFEGEALRSNRSIMNEIDRLFEKAGISVKEDRYLDRFTLRMGDFLKDLGMCGD